MESPESERTPVRDDRAPLSSITHEPFDPADDAYADNELQRRVERMDRMIEKALGTTKRSLA
jgi:hypothetical protein